MIIHTFKDGRLVYRTQEKYIYFFRRTGEIVNGIMCVVLRNIITNSLCIHLVIDVYDMCVCVDVCLWRRTKWIVSKRRKNISKTFTFETKQQNKINETYFNNDTNM